MVTIEGRAGRIHDLGSAASRGRHESGAVRHRPVGDRRPIFDDEDALAADGIRVIEPHG
jgi:hypothetical protein